MNQKLHVFLRRVSGANQDLETQIEFDRPFREKCNKENIFIVDEDATSANKLRIHQRPKLMEILELIKADKVDTIYAYDRTRLFRDYYEAQAFCKACVDHEVNIVFTSVSNGHLPFTNDIFIESILNLFGDIEGKNIARRTEEARRKYPSKKFGYQKTSDKKYKKIEETKTIIEEFFIEVQQVNTMEELILFLEKYRMSFNKKRTDENLLRMVSDPFYASYDLVGGKYQLPHVDPFLSIDNFLEIQEKIAPIIKNYEEHILGIQSLLINLPKCGYCLKPLKPKLTKDRCIAFLSCSSGHPKVYYEIQLLNEAIKHTIELVLNQLDANNLLEDSLRKIKQICKTLNEEMDKIKKQIQQTSDYILFSETSIYDNNWENTKEYKKINELQHIYQDLENELDQKQKLLVENQQLYRLTVEAIDAQAQLNIRALTDLLIKEVRIFTEKIEIDISKVDYINDFNSEIILHQEVNS